MRALPSQSMRPGECCVLSEILPDGKKTTKLDQILLNGNNVALLVPGSEYVAIVML